MITDRPTQDEVEALIARLRMARAKTGSKLYVEAADTLGRLAAPTDRPSQQEVDALISKRPKPTDHDRYASDWIEGAVALIRRLAAPAVPPKGETK